MKARRRNAGEQVERPGDYKVDFTRKLITIWLPVEGVPDALVQFPFDPAMPTHWTLSGTDARPTLEPSILTTGRGWTWHGYLRDGQFIAC